MGFGPWPVVKTAQTEKDGRLNTFSVTKSGAEISIQFETDHESLFFEIHEEDSWDTTDEQ